MIAGLDGENLSGAAYSAAELSADGSRLLVLDQRRLPNEETYLEYTDEAGAAESIRDMVVRGAPAIGVTAAYGMVLAARRAEALDANSFVERMGEAAALLDAARPTAVNLTWATRRCFSHAREHAAKPGAERAQRLAELARAIHRDDVAACRAIGRLGAELLHQETTLLTHCNAGALATGGYGTALGVVRAARDARKLRRVYATETRPYLQGARLTAWELHRDGIDVTLITDSMVAHCMRRGMIDAVVVGADRIAKNGDVANKIGTYGLACLAKLHDVPFYVAAPWSTIDLETPHGDDIIIEERSSEELTRIGTLAIAPAGVTAFNPAFDVTPASLVTAIVTERAVHAAKELAAFR